MPPFPFFIRSLVTLTPRIIIWAFVKAAVFKFLSLQSEVTLSLFVPVKCRHPKFLWLWCIRELILHAGWEGHCTQPRGWQSMGRQQSCNCACGGWDNPYTSLAPFCLSAALPSQIHSLCQPKTARSALPEARGHGAGDRLWHCAARLGSMDWVLWRLQGGSCLVSLRTDTASSLVGRRRNAPSLFIGRWRLLC